MMESGGQTLEVYRAAIYDPKIHRMSIETYMSKTKIPNNKNPKIFRLDEYDNFHGALFLVFDSQNQIRAVSSVLLSKSKMGPAAKIYGRFHIEEGVPHTIIDRFFEPMTLRWCAERQVRNIFFTINEENYKVLDWSSRRVGERRNIFRANTFALGVGAEVRAGFIPLNGLIYERHCWQYTIFYNPENRWFLDGPIKLLDETALTIFRREFPRATQDWN